MFNALIWPLQPLLYKFIYVGGGDTRCQTSECELNPDQIESIRAHNGAGNCRMIEYATWLGRVVVFVRLECVTERALARPFNQHLK